MGGMASCVVRFMNATSRLLSTRLLIPSFFRASDLQVSVLFRMTKSGVHRIERKSSIESEPRTLLFDEIQFAREGALYIVNATTTEEATAIFTKGLKPVTTTNMKEKIARTDSTDDEEWHYVRAHLRIPQFHEDMRDVVTAPF